MNPLTSLLLPEYASVLTAAPAGYFDVTGDRVPPVHTLAQRLMRARAYAAVYQGLRPLGRRALGGFRGPGREADRVDIARQLRLRRGAVVFDIGCGPGNFTGWFGETVGEGGLAVGLDASAPMLTRAAKDNTGTRVRYVRGDAASLPFADETADAVSCLAALYLFDDPRRAISEMLRVLKPGGRLVILTSLGPPITSIRRAAETVGGATLFARDEVTGYVKELGGVEVQQAIQGVTQTVTATRPQR